MSCRLKSISMLLLSASLLALFSVAAAGAGSSTDAVVITGSTTVLPAIERCAEAFNSAQDEIEVQVSGGGTGRGVQDAASGLADIGMASRDVSPDEIQKFGDKFQGHLIGYDAICIVVSDDVYAGGVHGLSSEDMSRIYRNEVNNWKPLGGQDREILCVSRMAGSGTRDTFSEVILGSARAMDDGVDVYAQENAEVKTIIRQSRGAIGYLSLQYAQSGVKIVALDGVMPNIENLENRSYKLARPLLLYTWGPAKGKDAKFLDFVLGPEGQKIIEDEGFVAVQPHSQPQAAQPQGGNS